MRAKGLAAVDAADALGTIEVIGRVHSVDADQQHVANVAVVLREYRRNEGRGQKHGACKNEYSFPHHRRSLLMRTPLLFFPRESTPGLASSRRGAIDSGCLLQFGKAHVNSRHARAPLSEKLHDDNGNFRQKLSRLNFRRSTGTHPDRVDACATGKRLE